MKYFYCTNGHCSSALNRKPVEMIAQELKGKKLCRTCYNRGLELRIGVEVTYNKKHDITLTP